MSNTAYKPKSKRRKMKRFVLDEISLVDKPAQEGAVMTIMKRDAAIAKAAATAKAMERISQLFEAQEVEVPTDQVLQYQQGKMQKHLRALDAKLDRLLKATDLRNVERTAPYRGEGPEFEKEPEEEEYEVDAEEEEDEDEMDKGGVPYRGKPHRGDWPPHSDDPESSDGPPKNTRTNDYVSDDESGTNEMTPERASEVLQPYADGGEDDEDEDEYEEEVQHAVGKLADRLAKRFPRASNASIEKMVEGALHSSHTSYDPRFGREREYAKRVAERDQPVRKTYSDEVLLDRLHKRFGATFENNFDKNFGKYFRR